MKIRVLLIACIGLLSVHCKGRDYYSDLTNPVASDHCDIKKKELDDACRKAIEKNVNLDQASFVGHEEVKEAMLQAIHALLVSPIEFPKDKKFLGLAYLRDLQAWEFQDLFLSDPGANLNQKFTNYVLNGFSKLGYGTYGTSSAFYDGTDQSVRVHGTVGSAWLDASVLLHEVRHGEAFNHTIDCPADQNLGRSSGRECDTGMDLSNGWELILSWGLLQGSSNTNAMNSVAMTADEATHSLVSTDAFCHSIHEIFDFPGNALAMANFDCAAYELNFKTIEDLHFAK